MDPTTRALTELGAVGALSTAQLARLDRDGFVVLPDFVDADRLAALRARIAELRELEGPLAGREVSRRHGAPMLANLINKGEVFEPVFTEPQLLAGAYRVLGEFRVNSLNFRAAAPGTGHQELHSDWGEPVAGHYRLCNSIWLLDDFTADNGATRVVPGSHRWDRPPDARHPNEQLLLGPAGTVVIFNAHLWHGGTRNRTDTPRRAITMSYCRRDDPQQLDQAAHVRPEVYERLSPAARFILDV